MFVVYSSNYQGGDKYTNHRIDIFSISGSRYLSAPSSSCWMVPGTVDIND